MAGEGETAAPAVPNDADVESARATQARRENLAKAREARAEKRKSGKDSESGAKVAAEGGRPAPAHEGALFAGCRGFVRLCWLLARLGAFIAGGQLAPLTDAELSEGAAEAVPVVRRFAFLASLLAFVGFPLWLVRNLADKFSRNTPREHAGPGAAQSPAPSPASGNVVSIGAGK